MDFKTDTKQCSCYESIMKLNIINNETLLYNKWLYYYYYYHHQNLLSIVLFTQEFNIILDKKGSDTLQFFNQCLSHHFAITSAR